jgi:hypothetical protein
VTECTPQIDLFSIDRRAVTATFDQAQLSSDTGVVLLRQIDRELRLSARLSGTLMDRRQSGKVRHTVSDLVLQRILQICAGYEDASDANTLRDDPAFQIALGRTPGEDHARLASQPTLSRFERRSRRELVRFSNLLLDLWIERLRRRAKKSHQPPRIVLDFDSTDFITYGEQQLALFHGHYGHYIYYPLLAFDQFGFPVAALLRPGRTRRAGVAAVLLRIVERLTAAFPTFHLTIRADAGFSFPDLYELCETIGIDYVIGLITHPKLNAYAEPWMREARTIAATEGHATLIRDFTVRWGRKTPHPRRIITKAEVTSLGDNPRFMITNLTTPAEQVYDFYTQRGRCENHIKDLKNALLADRMSCHLFNGNQFRLLLHTAAYILMLTLRERLAGTVLASVQLDTLRLRLIKIASLITVTARRIWLRMSAAHPAAPMFQLAAARLNTS